jgi:thiol-disulfide isomerase/thioredoxin
MNPFERYKDKVLIIVHPMCPACQSVKEKILSDEKMKNATIVLDVTKDEDAKTIAEAFDIDSVPAILYSYEENKKLVMCLLDDKLENVVKCMEVEYAEETEKKE